MHCDGNADVSPTPDNIDDWKEAHNPHRSLPGRPQVVKGEQNCSEQRRTDPKAINARQQIAAEIQLLYEWSGTR